jgi:hypothetical protein
LFLGVVILGFNVGSYRMRVDLTMVVLNYFLAKFSLFLTTTPVAFFLMFLYPWASLEWKLESEED